jgi:hypothetical protein
LNFQKEIRNFTLHFKAKEGEVNLTTNAYLCPCVFRKSSTASIPELGIALLAV